MNESPPAIRSLIHPADAREAYKASYKFRINGFLAEECLPWLVELAASRHQYRQAYTLNNQYFEASPEDLRALAPSQRQELIRAVYSEAAQGRGFWYGRRGLDNVSSDKEQILFDWLNSEEVLNYVRELTGEQKLTSATVQLTSMAPGDFLTRHRDDVGSRARKVAFVINLTEGWHPDWGGILQFYDQSGNPTDSWSPLFNTLCLFDVREIHSVTCISPFAPRHRLAISGWFQER